MPIKVENKGVEAILQEAYDNLRRDILEELVNIGELAIKLQKNSHLYHDQTGNLTSSLGFVVVEDGKIYQLGGIEKVKNGDEGVKAAENLLKAKASEATGFSLILVAGMEYASFVEDLYAKNVLQTARLYCLGKVPEQIKAVVDQHIDNLNRKLKQ